MAHTLLVVDDEADIRRMLQDYFELSGYNVITAANAEEALKMAEKQPDMVLLDIGMPGMDGIALCQSVREFVHCPIMFLTARVEQADKLRAFAAGGDDYVVKPFSMEELGARVAAHLRREERHKGATKVKLDADFAIDYLQRQVYCKGEPIALAKKEYDIVELLSQHVGQVFDKERIYDCVWGLDGSGESSVVAEHIRRIRVKFAAAGAKPYIETIWGVGYRWQR